MAIGESRDQILKCNPGLNNTAEGHGLQFANASNIGKRSSGTGNTCTDALDLLSCLARETRCGIRDRSLRARGLLFEHTGHVAADDLVCRFYCTALSGFS